MGEVFLGLLDRFGLRALNEIGIAEPAFQRFGFFLRNFQRLNPKTFG